MAKIYPIAFTLLFATTFLCCNSQSLVVLDSRVNKLPQYYFSNEYAGFTITQPADGKNQYYFLNLKGRYSGIINDQLSDYTIESLTVNTANQVFVSTGPQNTYLQIEFNEDKVEVKLTHKINSDCDYSRPYHQYADRSAFVTICTTKNGKQGLELFDTLFDRALFFDADYTQIGVGDEMLFVVNSQKEVGYYSFSSTSVFNKVGTTTLGQVSAIISANSSLAILVVGDNQAQAFDIQYKKSGPIASTPGIVYASEFDQIFYADPNSKVSQLTIQQDLTIIFEKIVDLSTIGNGQPVANIQSSKSLLQSELMVFFKIPPPYTNSPDQYMIVTLGILSQELIISNIDANFPAFASSSFKNNQGIEYYFTPNGYSIFDNSNYQEFVLDPFNAIYTKDLNNLILFGYPANTNNCTITKFDNVKFEVKTSIIQGCQTNAKRDSEDKILAYNDKDEIYYIFHYPYIMKIANDEVQATFNHFFDGFDVLGFPMESYSIFAAVGIPLGKTNNPTAWFFNISSGDLIRKQTFVKGTQLFKANNTCVYTVTKTGAQNYLVTLSNLATKAQNIGKVNGINGVSDMLLIGEFNILLDTTGYLFSCKNLGFCHKVQLKQEFSNPQLQYIDKSLFIVKEANPGFGIISYLSLDQQNGDIIELLQ